MEKFREANVSYEQLLLDPNNYRFIDSPRFSLANERRLHEDSVQDRAYSRMRDDVEQLKDSILTNGLMPIERLVIRPYAYAEDLYVVIEGNRRLAAIRWIAEDDDAGISAPDSVLDDIENIPVVIIFENEEDYDPIFLEALLGVRHVAGTKQWGGYQRARVITTLRDEHGLSSQEVAGRLGMTVREVNRRYRAFRALQQMRDHEDHGSFARSDMYPIFHEAVDLPKVREWLGWNDTSYHFTNEEQLEHFYDLITPNPEESPTQDPKIKTYGEVRELRNILSNSEAKRVLLDPSRSLLDAISIAKHDELSRSWVTQVSEAIDALRSVRAADLDTLSEDDLTQLRRLKEEAEKLLETHRKVVS